MINYRKKHRYLIFPLSCIFIILINFTPITYSYPTFEGDCRNHHGTSYIRVPYDSNTEIILDGIPSESFWTNPNNKEGIIEIPTAKKYGNYGDQNITLNLKFVRNDYYIFICCEWLDNSTKPDLGSGIYDGLFFCWNIDVPNFTAYYKDDMNTIDMGGGNIDVWSWTYDSDTSYSNHSSYYCSDLYLKENGFNTDIQKNVMIGIAYRVNYSYTIELKRALKTEEVYDVQFSQIKLFEFNMGVINDGYGIDHYISWTYSLDLKIYSSDEDNEEESQKKLNLQFLVVVIATLSVGLIFFIVYYKHKRLNIQKRVE